MDIYLRIKELRKSNNLTQSDFGDIIKVDSSHFGKIERGLIRPTIPQLMDISAYFDVSLDWLIAGQKNKPKAQNPLNLIKEFNGDIPRGAKPFWNLQVSGGRKLVEMISNIMPVGYMEGIRIPGFEQTENIFPVVGYSMAPEVMENAVIGARQILNRWEILRTDKKHLIITNEERMIKYIQHDDNDENILWCVSPNYSKFKIYKDDILEIHQITFVMNPS